MTERRGRPFLGALACVAAILLAAATAPGSAPEAAPSGTLREPFLRGMAYGIFGRSGAAFHEANIDALRALGANSLLLTVPREQRTVASVRITSDDPHLTPSRASLADAIRLAHERGMSIVLLPILFIRETSGDQWRGSLAPSDWSLWWQAYEAFILDEARWAATHDVEIFSVGSELCSTERFRGRWENLIGRVRAVYPGRITYSANWDHLEGVTFAPALDLAGMNAYFEVGSADPEVGAMERRWASILPEVEAWQRRHGRPILVTEVGYPSRKGGTIDPWNHAAGGEPDVAEQELGYRAFINAWSGRPWLAGVYFYMWWDDPGDGGIGYTPRGKPAAGTLTRWYTQGLP